MDCKPGLQGANAGDFVCARCSRRGSPGVVVEPDVVSWRRAGRVAVLHRERRPKRPPHEVAVDQVLRDGLVAPARVEHLHGRNQSARRALREQGSCQPYTQTDRFCVSDDTQQAKNMRPRISQDTARGYISREDPHVAEGVGVQRIFGEPIPAVWLEPHLIVHQSHF